MFSISPSSSEENSTPSTNRSDYYQKMKQIRSTLVTGNGLTSGVIVEDEMLKYCGHLDYELYVY